MATTTQILFNSPALHSLKREQLVKLCKIHHLKANGKNSEMIERLKQRAQELPEQDMEREETDEEDSYVSDLEQGAIGGLRELISRPSEQWEVVMEDIQEVDELSSATGTLSSMKSMRSGEFGSSSSKTSVGSSLKALASSLGIKRSLSAKSVTSSKDLPSSSSMPVLKKAGTDELDKHAVPYSSIPQSTSMPQTDHFKFSTPDASIFTPTEDVSMTAPIPGTPMRPGQPVPTNARLSTGTGATTTIRLITSPFSSRVPSPPRLTPYQTDFNIIMDSPGGENEGVRVWPASPALASEKIYPALPVEDMAFLGKVTTAIAGNTPAKPPAVTVTKPNGTPALPQMPRDGPKDVFSPMKVPGSAARGSVSRSQPFLFGSPLPQHRVSNHDFGKAAASLLQEMNKRLSEAGVQGIDNSILERKPGSVDVFGPTSVESQQRFEAVDRFAQVHEEAFDKMDSIATHYAARRGVAEPTSKKRKSNVLGHGPAPSVGKRKSSVASHTGTRVISNGVRRNMGLPGGFGEDDQGDIEEEETRDPGDRRSSKRIRVTDEPGVNKGVRVSLAPPVPNLSEEEREKEKRKEKEREVIKRKLDAQKARRRSSRARVSISGKTPAGKSRSRFGFLSSAKSLVRNVWNFGAGSSKAAPSNNAAGSKQPPPPPTKLVPAAKVPPTTSVTRKASNIHLGSANSNTVNSKARVPSVGIPSNTLKPDANTIHVDAASARSRSPLSTTSPTPRNLFTPSAPSGTPSIAGTIKSGTTPNVSSTSSRLTSHTGSVTSPSSFGTRPRLASGQSTDISSFGTRKSPATTTEDSVASSRGNNNVQSHPMECKPTPRRPTSTLLAPTASSLAKANGVARSSLLPVPQGSNLTKHKKITGTPTPTLQQITNSPQSPRTTKIFSSPLAGFGSPNAIPASARIPSLTTAANKLVEDTQGASTTSTATQALVPLKPKILVSRKPRISRSRVIAKLGAQRAASGSSVIPRANIAPSPRVRSSMANGTRRSFAGVKGTSTSRESMVLSAKKQVRKSEYARRKSRIAERPSMAQGLRRNTMDVDA